MKLFQKINNILLKIFIKNILYFKYPRISLISILKFNLIPRDQLLAMDIALRIIKIFKKEKIKFILLGGCLLGAIRQGNFAGRPKDIDFGLEEKDFEIMRNNTNNFKKEFKNNIFHHPWIPDPPEHWYSIRNDRFYMTVYEKLVDIKCLKFNNETKLYHAGSASLTGIQTYFGKEDIENPITTKCYLKKFYIPQNSVQNYLIPIYGQNWHIPEKKQYQFSKKKF